jgi:xanthine dehydrogenase YagS FAD-binding subunit
VRQFAYEQAPDVAGAVSVALANPGSRFLGGGTNLVDLMRLGVEQPELVIDVTGLPLEVVESTSDGGLRIGALARNSDVAADRAVRRGYPMLAEAILSGASGQVRNQATTGGNLLQRTRCGYFTDVTKPCNKRLPGTGCPARTGEHHNLAIFGASEHCIATHPSDLAVALSALDARVEVREPGGPREIALSDFYRPVGDTPEREVTMAEGGLITAIIVPPLPMAAGSRYRKVRERASFAFAIGSIAAAIDVVDGDVRDVRIALGAVASMPWRAREAEQALLGRRATENHFLAAADRELARATPLPGNAYKVALVRNLIVRTLAELVAARP